MAVNIKWVKVCENCNTSQIIRVIIYNVNDLHIMKVLERTLTSKRRLWWAFRWELLIIFRHWRCFDVRVLRKTPNKRALRDHLIYPANVSEKSCSVQDGKAIKAKENVNWQKYLRFFQNSRNPPKQSRWPAKMIFSFKKKPRCFYINRTSPIE